MVLNLERDDLLEYKTKEKIPRKKDVIFIRNSFNKSSFNF